MTGKEIGAKNGAGGAEEESRIDPDGAVGGGKTWRLKLGKVRQLNAQGKLAGEQGPVVAQENMKF